MTVLILDAYNLLFRSFASLPPSITARDGLPINAVYGMVASVIRLVRDVAPAHIVAAFDEPDVPTFRHRAYPAYQAQRGPLGGENADEFRRQVAIAATILPALGVPALSQAGYEADDIMGTMAREVGESAGLALLVSTDRDLLQLVGERAQIILPGATGVRIGDAQAVRERIGVPPEAVTTFKSLAGDASDNIPGIPGIGPKTAVKLIDGYETLENLFSHLGELPSRTATALEAGHDAAFLFREISTIVNSLDLPLNANALPDPRITPDSKVRDLLEEVGYGRPETDSHDGTPGGIRTPDL